MNDYFGRDSWNDFWRVIYGEGAVLRWRLGGRVVTGWRIGGWPKKKKEGPGELSGELVEGRRLSGGGQGGGRMVGGGLGGGGRREPEAGGQEVGCRWWARWWSKLGGGSGARRSGGARVGGARGSRFAGDGRRKPKVGELGATRGQQGATGAGKEHWEEPATGVGKGSRWGPEAPPAGAVEAGLTGLTCLSVRYPANGNRWWAAGDGPSWVAAVEPGGAAGPSWAMRGD
ncbi:glycine-rich cell wall structural protein 1.8-like [Cryptomeria japonica]|uniref:glycine-rich cell wall structural protein 1.8-like n=1 Tax=Cryptomeria japonica TaxID=3369 RepID=UPI0027DA6023|nr:glycine-rich cell wall structural protein 1.8-like [Cryptomeria japonica]